MLNINYGRNSELLDACEPLKEYSWFVAAVNENQKEMNNLEAAVDGAIDQMPEECLIKAFLMENRAEVKRMCITEYNEARTRAEDREEGRAEGRAEGESKLAALLVKLKEVGRIDDAFKAASDPAFRAKLYQEFSIA